MKEQLVPAIKKIKAKNLFGLYDYDLSLPSSGLGSEKVSILYGDNGRGKTTLLKLAFHLLAPEGKSGHRTVASKIPFTRFEIEMVDNTSIWAERTRQLIGTFTMGIKRPKNDETTAVFHFEEGKDDFKQIRKFLSELNKLDIGLYLLTDDRQIHLAGNVKDHSVMYVDSEFPEGMVLYEPNIKYMYETNLKYNFQRKTELDPEEVAQYLLKQSIERTETWIRRRAMKGATEGESSVNTIYNEILKQLVSLPQDKRLDTSSTKRTFESRVAKLESECTKFAKYGLMPQFQGKEILTAVSKAPSNQLPLIATVIGPYLESLEKKLEVYADTYKRVDTLVTIINERFIKNKTISFDLQSGFTIIADDNSILTPKMLSSGERHLFLLFCNSFVAVDRPSIMMIDEPEISLNVKWQRNLLSSLLECIGDSPIQYIFATHSMELLAKHRKRVVELTNLR